MLDFALVIADGGLVEWSWRYIPDAHWPAINSFLHGVFIESKSLSMSSFTTSDMKVSLQWRQIIPKSLIIAVTTYQAACIASILTFDC